MIYKLLRKTFGTKQISDIATVNTEYPVKDICYVDGCGVIFSDGTCLGKIDDDGNVVLPWKSKRRGEDGQDEESNSPIYGQISSLNYLPKLNLLYVGENGGCQVRMMDLIENETYKVFLKQSAVFVDKLFKNVPKDDPIYIAPMGRDRFYFVSNALSKCFYYNNSDFKHIAGDGKYRFSNGTNPICSSIGCPSGIAVYNNKVYISDELNNIVREISNGKISIYLGKLTERVIEKPSKILVTKDAMYVLCRNGVFVKVKGASIGATAIYASDKIISISIDNNGGLYILEEHNA